MLKYQQLTRSSCTRSRGRTGTALRPLVFETSASTDSAIRAFDRGAKVGNFGEVYKFAVRSAKTQAVTASTTGGTRRAKQVSWRPGMA